MAWSVGLTVVGSAESLDEALARADHQLYLRKVGHAQHAETMSSGVREPIR